MIVEVTDDDPGKNLDPMPDMSDSTDVSLSLEKQIIYVMLSVQINLCRCYYKR